MQTTKTLEFIVKARKVHGDKYDYSQVDYVNAHHPVKIRCIKCDIFFEIKPNTHLSQKQGCRICGMKNRKHPGQKTNSTFIQQAFDKWGDLYDYTETKYVNKKTKITYKCIQCNKDVQQMPTLHLKSGCPYCAGRGESKHTLETFVKKANEVHNSFYKYDKVKFESIKDKITITCPECGDFQQCAANHINLGNGCPGCNGGVYFAKNVKGSYSKKEIAEFLKPYTIPDNLKIKLYKSSSHTESSVGKKYHLNKANLAKKANIQLIQIFEYEWIAKKDIIKSRLLSILGKNKVISARKTKITIPRKEIARAFLQRAHLQGRGGDMYLGLEYDNKLVACMTFGESRFNKKYKYELIRYSSECNVVGGASKLLKHFRENCPGSIISYADRRWSIGNLYEKLGFSFDGETEPGYVYYSIKTKEVVSRIKFQKHKLANMPYYDKKLSEYDIMKLNGYDRIWDAGHTRWIL